MLVHLSDLRHMTGAEAFWYRRASAKLLPDCYFGVSRLVSVSVSMVVNVGRQASLARGVVPHILSSHARRMQRRTPPYQ
jgi:hypothetical protein